jgi:hypothetical protein
MISDDSRRNRSSDRHRGTAMKAIPVPRIRRRLKEVEHEIVARRWSGAVDLAKSWRISILRDRKNVKRSDCLPPGSSLLRGEIREC